MNLRKARELAEMTRTALARKAGIDPSLISKLEAGDRAMTVRTARKLAAALRPRGSGQLQNAFTGGLTHGPDTAAEAEVLTRSSGARSSTDSPQSEQRDKQEWTPTNRRRGGGADRRQAPPRIVG